MHNRGEGADRTSGAAVSANGIVVAWQELADGGRVARVTIDNRAKRNSLGRALLERLVAAAEALAGDSRLRLVVLSGAGGHAFVGGADIGEIAALDREGARGFITLVHRCCEAFRRLPVPVIARIDGYALGAGLELAASCDLRVASEGSRFGMPEVRIGIPSVVEAALLPRLVGWGRARRLLLTGETIDAAEALAWGLVDAVAPAAALDAAVERFARPILAAGPQAIRLQKALIREWEDLPVGAAIARGLDYFVHAFDSDEPNRMARAALAALRARREAPSP
jgi:enoyl-CoA hydratase